MADQGLQQTIESAWEAREDISFDTKGEIRDAVDTALDMLDRQQATSYNSRSRSTEIFRDYIAKNPDR